MLLARFLTSFIGNRVYSVPELSANLYTLLSSIARLDRVREQLRRSFLDLTTVLLCEAMSQVSDVISFCFM